MNALISLTTRDISQFAMERRPFPWMLGLTIPSIAVASYLGQCLPPNREVDLIPLFRGSEPADVSHTMEWIGKEESFYSSNPSEWNIYPPSPLEHRFSKLCLVDQCRWSLCWCFLIVHLTWKGQGVWEKVIQKWDDPSSSLEECFFTAARYDQDTLSYLPEELTQEWPFINLAQHVPATIKHQEPKTVLRQRISARSKNLTKAFKKGRDLLNKVQSTVSKQFNLWNKSPSERLYEDPVLFLLQSYDDWMRMYRVVSKIHRTVSCVSACKAALGRRTSALKKVLIKSPGGTKVSSE